MSYDHTNHTLSSKSCPTQAKGSNSPAFAQLLLVHVSLDGHTSAELCGGRVGQKDVGQPKPHLQIISTGLFLVSQQAE